ncbi:MAG: hypothetical protein KA204_00570 [Chromatiaceae bacterium]|nr:hypothetical protein [Chromatiaceae bacterium]MBP6735656.1 hypothetical protein [Chromatiaceae bacterium]MBP8291024.1 hypothetical protein [Chromatiaceae bacterium]
MHDPYSGRSRRQYLQDLAGEYELPLDVVLVLASLLGPNEDFDGLVTELCDIADSGEFADFDA